jgi:membrane protein implicated in regulation of membrane protease activity
VPVIWLIVGVVLALAELFTLDFVLIMLAGGAFAAALAGLVDASVPIQVVVFGAVSALGLLALRPTIKRHLHRGADPAVMGVAAIEGAEATVIEQVAEGRGMSKWWRPHPVRPHPGPRRRDYGSRRRGSRSDCARVEGMNR